MINPRRDIIEYFYKRGIVLQFEMEVERQEIFTAGSRATRYMNGRVTCTLTACRENYQNSTVTIVCQLETFNMVIGSDNTMQWFFEEIESRLDMGLGRSPLQALFNDMTTHDCQWFLMSNEIPKPIDFVTITDLQDSYDV